MDRIPYINQSCQHCVELALIIVVGSEYPLYLNKYSFCYCKKSLVKIMYDILIRT